MIDRITEVDPHGGAWGLGLIVSEKDLEPDHWYFPCHFSDDQVMAGSLVAEGCSQLLQFYLLYMGFQLNTRDARFQPVPDLPQVVRTRKQITACSSKLIYRMEITEIGLSPHLYAKANVDIIFEGRVVVDFKNLGLQLREKPADDYYAKAIGGRQPTPLPVPVPSTVTAQHTTAGPALFDDSHIENFAVGSISACFGPDYQVFEGRRIPRTPNGPLKLISRIVEINAERLVFSGNPNLVSEYDVSVDPWFCQQNAYPTTPYSILMEIGLQPCGFLSAYLGSTLPHADQDFYFRNLDGDGLLGADIDVRGKTITNRVALLSSTAITGIIIQKFSYQLEADGQVFYKGTAVFGYFQPQALANQVGLDQGKMVLPWWQQAGAAGLPVTKLNLVAPSTRQQLYQADSDKPFYRLAGNQLDFLDEALIIPTGGGSGQGYIHAAKKVNPDDWFFKAHFYQDPVMPGSLGVEAILQAMQIFALHQDLGAGLQSPHFTQVPGHKMVWIYRGQITPNDSNMQLEIHITNIERAPGQVTLFGDASLWKGGMRIYEVKQVALRLAE
jgi:3-hydroxymyristoyl/3-hydroxydecanoyl-(acyl carrier protein) dehydratase